jgi:hypothetical protein
MSTPTPEEQAKLMAGWDAKFVARVKAGYAKAAVIKDAGGLASEKTLRDHFAGQALAGILALGRRCTFPEVASENAYIMADAMLEARKTTGEGE